ncbi:bifunctional helix-turn-helix transcriptional regulator/GNAT family N-acetyltransferase [Acidisoma sp. C75]
MSLDPVARVRRFNRAVTSAVGALDHSFLRRGRTLGAARVLNAIGHGKQEVAAIRDYLGLDSGLMSRLLRGLEAERLVEVRPGPGDGRRRTAHLTPAGLAEFRAYERISDRHAKAMLGEGQSRAGRLLEAMDLIATALGAEHVMIEAHDPRDALARYCLGEYYAELSRRLAAGFDVTLSKDPDAALMMPPRGTFLVAMSDGLPLGCIGLKGTNADYAEIKRLWVAPAGRGLGLGRRLMEAAEEAARGLGIACLHLDSNSALAEALALYAALGWREIPRFNDDPYPDRFFEKQLG